MAAIRAAEDTFKETEGWTQARPSDELPRGTWWEVFGDDQLNALEAGLAGSNEDLKAADAHFREARALIGVNRAAQSPVVALAPSAALVRNSGNTSVSSSTLTPPITGVYSVPLDLSYGIDVWGRIHRTVDAARDRAQASARTARRWLHQSAGRARARLLFELRPADADAICRRGDRATFLDVLRLTNNRFQGGGASRSDVAQAKTPLEWTATDVQATDLAVQRARYEHAIAAFHGRPISSALPGRRMQTASTASSQAEA